LVFVDETCATTNMARRSGRARRGEHLIGAIPHGHRKTTTFVAALREDRIAAPLVIDRAMNGTIFKAWVEQFLAPGLGPGDIVIMDNLPVHKVAGVAAAITATGAELMFLPSYSPDLNPIEQTFSKLKALLRAAAERTIDSLWRRIGICLDQFSAEQCANYFRNAGYRSV
jgi:transposase|tara:strand:- start:262 stop:771 length:510 start_codon:yes stop_codon:yes gene_type:complete